MRSKTVEFKVSARYALFSDPNMRLGGEKFTYQVPTYEALKGMLMSVYWKPTIIWYIDKVRIVKKIQTETKGVKTLKIAHGPREAPYDLSYYTYLKDVEYQVQAHFEWNMNRPELAGDRNENKHYSIAQRMIAKGGRRSVYLGTRECQGYVQPCRFGEGEGAYDYVPELSFGFMYHGITYADEAYSDETKGYMTKRFWCSVMKYGTITFIRPEDCQTTKKLHEMSIKRFSDSDEKFTCIDYEEVD